MSNSFFTVLFGDNRFIISYMVCWSICPHNVGVNNMPLLSLDGLVKLVISITF